MASEELGKYLGQVVEVCFEDGESIVGRLLKGQSYAIELPAAGPDQEMSLRAIPDVNAVRSVRALAAPPETFD
ncbi:MAG TPA: hypothetical protein VGX91_04045 [Candidatus Cybelea sp.]|nr:hypothetical protein [Candidatus Cybelea sp.]